MFEFLKNIICQTSLGEFFLYELDFDPRAWTGWLYHPGFIGNLKELKVLDI